MKIKNTSADFVKNISLFFLIMIVGTIDAMDRIITLFRQQPDYVSRKESRIDFLQLHEIGPWYANLSDKQKRTIENNLNDKDEIGRSRAALFYFATCCPRDVQKVIVTFMCRKDFEEKYTEEITKEFHGNIALCKAFYAYEFTKKVFTDKDNFNKHLAKDSSFQPHIIFKYAKEISVFDKWSKNKDFCLSKNELQSIEKVCKEFKSIDKFEGQYKFYESYSIDNFITAFNTTFYNGNYSKDSMLCMEAVTTAIISCLSSRFLKLNYYQKFVDLNIVKRNDERKELIEFLKESDVLEKFKSSVKSLRNPMKYKFMDKFKINFLPSLFPISFFYQRNRDEGWGSLSVVTGFTGIIYTAGNIFINKIFSDQALLVGSATCSLFMAGYTIISSLVQMRKVKSAKVSLKELSELLKRTDIMIE